MDAAIILPKEAAASLTDAYLSAMEGSATLEIRPGVRRRPLNKRERLMKYVCMYLVDERTMDLQWLSWR
jgi:hypothetical protein